MTTERTQEQILVKINKSESIFGFDREVLISFLEFEYAKKFLEKGTTEKEWAPFTPNTEAIIKDMENYMYFAWDKVENHRSISAERSIEKMTAYLWLLNENDLHPKIESEEIEYAQYGAPMLKAICDKYNFSTPDTKEILNMINGDLCNPLCEEGCSIFYEFQPHFVSI